MNHFLARWRAILSEHDWRSGALVLGMLELARGSSLAFIAASPALSATLPRFGGYEQTLGPYGWAVVFTAVGVARLAAIYSDIADVSALASFAGSVALGYLAYLGILTTGLETAPALIHHAVAAGHSLASGVIFLRAQRSARARATR